MDTSGKVAREEEVSGLASELADIRHGSAAGLIHRSGDVATEGGLQASTPLDVSPLGLGNINDDAMPTGKRRQVSREPPVPPPGFMNPGALGDRSLEYSSPSAEREDHSMQGAQLEVVDAQAQQQQQLLQDQMRPSSRSRLLAPPRVRAGLPQMARSKRPKSMPLSRGSSPRPLRPVLPGHELVTACRAGGEQDVEARLRVLEQQREDDH